MTTTAKTGESGPKRSRARVHGAQVIAKAADLLDLITEHDRSAAVAALRRNLKASRRFWSTKKKKWISEPDFRVRHDAALAILAYAYGKPIERQITASGTFQELSEILSRITASPMAMKKLPHLVPRHDQDHEKP